MLTFESYIRADKPFEIFLLTFEKGDDPKADTQAGLKNNMRASLAKLRSKNQSAGSKNQAIKPMLSRIQE